MKLTLVFDWRCESLLRYHFDILRLFDDGTEDNPGPDSPTVSVEGLLPELSPSEWGCRRVCYSDDWDLGKGFAGEDPPLVLGAYTKAFPDSPFSKNLSQPPSWSPQQI